SERRPGREVAVHIALDRRRNSREREVCEGEHAEAACEDEVVESSTPVKAAGGEVRGEQCDQGCGGLERDMQGRLPVREVQSWEARNEDRDSEREDNGRAGDGA